MAPVPDHWCRVGDPQLREAAAHVIRAQQQFGHVPPTPVSHVAWESNINNNMDEERLFGNEIHSPDLESNNADYFVKKEKVKNKIIKGRHHHHSDDRRAKDKRRGSAIEDTGGAQDFGKKSNKSRRFVSLRSIKETNGFHQIEAEKLNSNSKGKDFLVKNPSANAMKRSIKLGKYTFFEDGHDDHNHSHDDKQLINVFASIWAIENNLQANLPISRYKTPTSAVSTEMPDINETINITSSTTVSNFSRPDDGATFSASTKIFPPTLDSSKIRKKMTPVPELHTKDNWDEYNIPVLTPDLSLRNSHKNSSFDQEDKVKSKWIVGFKPRTYGFYPPKRYKFTKSSIVHPNIHKNSKENIVLTNIFKRNSRNYVLLNEDDQERAPEYMYDAIAAPGAIETLENDETLRDFDIRVERFIRDIFIPKEVSA